MGDARADRVPVFTTNAEVGSVGKLVILWGDHNVLAPS